MTARADFRFFHPFRVRYSEIDGQRVVYNAHYLTFFDTAIFEYYRAIGYDQFRESETCRRIACRAGAGRVSRAAGL